MYTEFEYRKAKDYLDAFIARGNTEAISLLEELALQAIAANREGWGYKYLDLLMQINIILEIEEAMIQVVNTTQMPRARFRGLPGTRIERSYLNRLNFRYIDNVLDYRSYAPPTHLQGVAKSYIMRDPKADDSYAKDDTFTGIFTWKFLLVIILYSGYHRLRHLGKKLLKLLSMR